MPTVAGIHPSTHGPRMSGRMVDSLFGLEIKKAGQPHLEAFQGLGFKANSLAIAIYNAQSGMTQRTDMRLQKLSAYCAGFGLP